MAHFNPQICEPSCCVKCAGKIILNEDNCTLCWEVSGDVVRAELWRMDDPPVLVAKMNSGCICSPQPGDYELKVFCGIGHNVTEYIVDEATVESGWDCDDDCVGDDCNMLSYEIEGHGIFSFISGTYFTSGARNIHYPHECWYQQKLIQSIGIYTFGLQILFIIDPASGVSWKTRWLFAASYSRSDIPGCFFPTYSNAFTVESSNALLISGSENTFTFADSLVTAECNDQGSYLTIKWKILNP